MTRDQIARVRAGWALVVPVATTFAALCYDRLFTLDPSLRAMFTRIDATSVQRMLVQTFGMIVAGIDDLDQLTPAIQVLGRRHAGYGVTDAHYRTMRDALLWTLDRALGDAFDDAARRAWEAAYALVAGIMQHAHATPAVIATTDRDRWRFHARRRHTSR
jgi:hemoglobin-like flavoprotein